MNHCLECGIAHNKRGLFCKRHHREIWHNRRKQRGAELYDIFMSLRYERDKASKLKLWSVLCSIGAAMRQEDNIKRKGRKSWDSNAYRRIPLTYSAGDGR